MYTNEELIAVAKAKKTRTLIAVIPTLAIFLLSIAIFVYGQINRSEKLWMVTVALTVLSLGTLLFLYGTWVKPARLYERHIRYMLHGKQITTTGYVKEISNEISIQESLPFYPLLLNVGEVNDPEDDRLFYYDAQKEAPPCAVGDKVTVTSNDRKISSVAKTE